jgi:uncharacterized protein YecT (DUF1311 family)
VKVILSFCLLCSSIPVLGLNIENYKVSGSSETYLHLAGSIVEGDYDRLLTHIKITPPSIGILEINSTGGNVLEVIKISKLIEKKQYSIYVRGVCASACSQIIYPSGFTSEVLPGGKLGFHSCYNSIAKNSNHICNNDIANLAVKRGYPYGMIDFTARKYGADDMFWLGHIGARCFGWHQSLNEKKPIFTGKPCIDVYIYLDLNNKETSRKYEASFDCKKVGNKIERVICDDEELAHVDRLLGLVYDFARKKSNIKKRKKLLYEQRLWIMNRNRECNKLEKSDKKLSICIYESIEKRIYKLLNISPNFVKNFEKAFSN